MMFRNDLIAQIFWENKEMEVINVVIVYEGVET